MSVQVQDFQARVQTIVQALAQVAALTFLIVYGLIHDGSVADTLIPGFLALAGINVVGGVASGALHAYASTQQAKITAGTQASQTMHTGAAPVAAGQEG